MTSIAVSYLPRKLSRSTEKAKSSAAEYTLSQLGYCSEVPSSFPAIPGQPLPLTDSPSAYAPPSAAFSAHIAPPKPPSWGPSPADPATIFAPPFQDPYFSQQMYGSPATVAVAPTAAHQELYHHQPLHPAPSHGLHPQFLRHLLYVFNN